MEILGQSVSLADRNDHSRQKLFEKNPALLLQLKKIGKIHTVV